MTNWPAFATKHDICATGTDVARMKRQLKRFYSAVEKIEEPDWGYLQLYHGDAVRAAFSKALPPGSALDASIAMAEMPDHWPTKYRASVGYHLCPILNDVINS